MFSDEYRYLAPRGHNEALCAAVHISNVSAGVGMLEVESIVPVSRVVNQATR